MNKNIRKVAIIKLDSAISENNKRLSFIFFSDTLDYGRGT